MYNSNEEKVKVGFKHEPVREVMRMRWRDKIKRCELEIGTECFYLHFSISLRLAS